MPEYATVTNSPTSGDQQTPYQALSAAEVLRVQLIPSGDVITLLLAPEAATATNSPNSGD